MSTQNEWGSIQLAVPDWIGTWFEGKSRIFPDIHQRMTLVIELARENLKYGGGPFGAAVFNGVSGELVAPGVNWVIPGNSSLLHAEVMALSLAERSMGNYELASLGEYELVTSVAPCCQCLGAVVWSGVSSLICGARSADAEEIGFDEGPRPSDWVDSLYRRGIRVTEDVMRDEAKTVLRSYQGDIYNADLTPVNRQYNKPNS